MADGLIKSARTGDLDDVIKRVSKGEDVNSTGPQHDLTPLHLASLHGHLDMVQFLLDNGADPDAVDKWNCTPLHNAAGAGQVDIVKELCESGAKMDVRTSKGKLPIEIAKDKGKFEVIPVLQGYMNKAGKAGKVVTPDPQQHQQQPTKSRGSTVDAYRGGYKGNKNVVIRKKLQLDKNGKPTRSNNVSLPGQIADDDDDDDDEDYSGRRVKQQKLQGKKKVMHKQLQHLEKQEQMHRLNSEHARTTNQMEQARQKYNSDLEDLLSAMEELQEGLNGLSGQRDSELTSMESRLHDLQDSMYELERAGSASSGDDDDEEDDRGGRKQRYYSKDSGGGGSSNTRGQRHYGNNSSYGGNSSYSNNSRSRR